MRRSICYTEPVATLAGEQGTWKFIYTPAAALPKGTILRFDIGSKGRQIDWQEPDVNLKKPSNVIYASLPNGKILQAEAIDLPNAIVPQFQFVMPQEIAAGASVTIIMGAPKGKDPHKNGNIAQLSLQRRRAFTLYIDTTGKGNFKDHEVFNLDIKGNALHTIKILAPSFVIKNRRFDVVLRFEDAYGNLTNNAPAKTLIEVTHGNLRENLHWKVFIPETGFLTLPNLYFNETGVYTMQLKNLHTKEYFYSSPIKCAAEDAKQLFWGILHGESERFDSTESIDGCLRHFRDEKSMNFYATSSFENADETSNEMWKSISQNIEEIDEEERFAAFLGFQWVGEPKIEGVHQIVYAKDQKPIHRKKDPRSNTLKKLYKLFTSKEVLSIPSFTMGKGYEYSFQEMSQEHERVVEIYNSWGSSECTKEEGNTRPIHGTGKNGIGISKDGSVLKALMSGYRFGFVAGGLDDRDFYAKLFDSDQVQYSPGLTAVYTDFLSREAIFDALYNRSCYATTGERIVVGFSIAGMPMGSEMDTSSKPGLHVNRHITGYVAGTQTLKAVELMRNDTVLTRFTSKTANLDFTYDDMAPLDTITLKAQNNKHPFIFYYLRVFQEDGHVAWSSPIWIDCTTSTNKVSGNKASPNKANPSKASPSKASPSKASPSKASPSKASPSKASPSKVVVSKTNASKVDKTTTSKKKSIQENTKRVK